MARTALLRQRPRRQLAVPADDGPGAAVATVRRGSAVDDLCAEFHDQGRAPSSGLPVLAAAACFRTASQGNRARAFAPPGPVPLEKATLVRPRADHLFITGGPESLWQTRRPPPNRRPAAAGVPNRERLASHTAAASPVDSGERS